MSRLAACVVVLLLLAAPAVAQTPVADLYAGYSVLYHDELEETFTKGFVASLAFSLSESVAIPLEFSWHSKDLELFDEDVATASLKTYTAGLRFGRRFYAQVLAGGVTGTVHLSGLGSGSETDFVLQPGIGIDIPFGSTVGFRLGGDYRRIFSDEAVNEWRGHVGLVFYLGSR